MVSGKERGTVPTRPLAACDRLESAVGGAGRVIVRVGGDIGGLIGIGCGLVVALTFGGSMIPFLSVTRAGVWLLTQRRAHA